MTSDCKYNKAIIIDDNSTDNFLNQMILKTNKICKEITVFTNPVVALNFFKEINENNDFEKIPEIIFLDINMPLMSGFEFLDEFIQLSFEPISKVKFYMLSSSDNPTDLERIQFYGDRIIKPLKKPLDKKEIL